MAEPVPVNKTPQRFPPVQALVAFSTTARLGSFTAAARELNHTQSAISHQIRELENRLGVRLFARGARGITLTPAGDAYLPHVQQALQHLHAGAQALQLRQRTQILTVSMSPNFAAKWLVPRLGSFSAAHPDLELRISATMEHVSFSSDDIDLAIRHGDGDWPGLHVMRLCAEELVPVCAPSLLGAGDAALTIRDLAEFPLLHDRDTQAWDLWLRHFGVRRRKRQLTGPVFNQMSLAIDAAVAGQGVALARSALVSLDLAPGRLVRPIQQSQPASFAYWLVCPSRKAAEPKVRTLTAWLQAEASRAEVSAGH